MRKIAGATELTLMICLTAGRTMLMVSFHAGLLVHYPQPLQWCAQLFVGDGGQLAETNINPLIQSSTFLRMADCRLRRITKWQLSRRGGIAWLAISPKYSKLGYKSAHLYRHQNTLRLMLERLGINTYPGDAKSASNMSEFFK
jgi:hypothetical protein